MIRTFAIPIDQILLIVFLKLEAWLKFQVSRTLTWLGMDLDKKV